MSPDILLIGALLVLVVFMFVSSRKRMKKMKEEQAEKARQTVPGVDVMLQSGIFGTIVAYDADDLDAPAEIEIAPGVVIKVHTQAIARIVTPAEVDEFADAELLADAPEIESIPEAAADAADTVIPETTNIPELETPEETRRRLEGDTK